MKAVFLPAVPESLDPKVRERRRHRLAFRAEDVVLVREIASVGAPEGVRTKIVLSGDRYEHHAIETDWTFAEVVAAIGWSDPSTNS